MIGGANEARYIKGQIRHRITMGIIDFHLKYTELLLIKHTNK